MVHTHDDETRWKDSIDYIYTTTEHIGCLLISIYICDLLNQVRTHEVVVRDVNLKKVFDCRYRRRSPSSHHPQNWDNARGTVQQCEMQPRPYLFATGSTSQYLKLLASPSSSPDCVKFTPKWSSIVNGRHRTATLMLTLMAQAHGIMDCFCQTQRETIDMGKILHTALRWCDGVRRFEEGGPCVHWRGASFKPAESLQ